MTQTFHQIAYRQVWEEPFHLSVEGKNSWKAECRRDHKPAHEQIEGSKVNNVRNRMPKRKGSRQGTRTLTVTNGGSRVAPQMMVSRGSVPQRGTSPVNSSHLVTAAAPVHTAAVDGKEEEAGGGEAGRGPATRGWPLAQKRERG